MKKLGTITLDEADAILQAHPSELSLNATQVMQVINFAVALQDEVAPFDPEEDERLTGDEIAEKVRAGYPQISS